MIPSLALLLLLLSSSTLAMSPARSPLRNRQAPCAPIHIIAARGSTEAPGPGAMATLAALIQQAHPGADLESIAYPAKLFPYADSSYNGTLQTTAQLTAYVRRCPASKVVLIGYSQGAHILLDSLCGGGGYVGIGPKSAPIAPAVGDHVVAIVQYGDPRHIVNQPYDTGTSTHNGLFPRQLPAQSCAHYASKISSWCDAGDPFCSDGFNLAAHLDYPKKYDTAAAAFVSGLLGP